MKPSEEIASLSDKAIEMLNEIINEQYLLGFKYATHCWGGNIRLPEVKETLKKVITKHEPEYLRSLIRNRK